MSVKSFYILFFAGFFSAFVFAQVEQNIKVCKDVSCSNSISVKPEFALKLVNSIISEGKENSLIKFCEYSQKERVCKTDHIGLWNISTLPPFIPYYAKINSFNYAKTENGKIFYSIKTTALGVSALCGNVEGSFALKESQIILDASNYCNWLGIGNLVANINIKVKEIYLNEKKLLVDLTAGIIGTGVGKTSSLAQLSFEGYDWITAAQLVGEINLNGQTPLSFAGQYIKIDAPANQEDKLTLIQQQASAIKPSEPLQASQSFISVTSNRKALVIGNDSYMSIPKLENAREDARTIASNLMSLGYQVTLKTDLNEKGMKSALRNFASQVQGGDEVMFFFAGHGVQLGAANYLLPTDILGDSEAQVKDEAIQLQRILDDMSERKAKFTLVMIDACRDNPFKSSARAIGGRGLAPTTAATGQMVIFSAGTGQQALDKLNNADKNKNGLFTRVFVQEMQKPSQSIDRVMKNVRKQVAELAKTVGHEQVPAIYDQVLGDFYFKK